MRKHEIFYVLQTRNLQILLCYICLKLKPEKICISQKTADYMKYDNVRTSAAITITNKV